MNIKFIIHIQSRLLLSIYTERVIQTLYTSVLHSSCRPVKDQLNQVRGETCRVVQPPPQAIGQLRFGRKNVC